MLDSARDNDELAFFELNGLVSKFDAEASLHHQEHFVFILVVMPYKFTFQLVEFYQLSIQFTRNVGLPILVNLGEFLSEVDLVRHGL